MSNTKEERYTHLDVGTPLEEDVDVDVDKTGNRITEETITEMESEQTEIFNPIQSMFEMQKIAIKQQQKAMQLFYKQFRF